MRARSLLVAATLGVCLGLATIASAAGVDPSAATPVQREQAQARFLRGKQLLDSRSFEPALAEFRASYDIVASPNTRLYVARSLRALGRTVEAYMEFGRTDVEAREHAGEDARYTKAADAAAAERDALKKQLGFVTVRVEHAEETTRLLVGTEEIRRSGWDEPIPVAPGAAEVRLETAGRAPVIGPFTVEAGQTKALSLDVASGARAQEKVVPPPEAPKPAPEAPPRSLRPFAYVAGGVGAVGLGAFGVFGLLAKSTHDGLVNRCPGGRCTASPASDVSKGRTQQTIANVALVVGAVGLAGGVVLFVMEPKRDAASVSATVGLGRLDLEGRF